MRAPGRRGALLLVVGAVLLLAGAVPTAAQGPSHNCSFCHNLHGGSYTALSDYATSEDLCLSCHSDAGPAQVDRDGVLVDVPRQQGIHDGPKHTAATTCWNCHDHVGEAGTNLAMIPLQRTTPASGLRDVLFTALSGPNSFADGDVTLDGICEVCHTATNYHRNYIGDTAWRQHNAAADCTACHPHDGGFQAQGGGCTSCHASAQGGRRPIVGEFARTSHHVDWSAAGYLAPDSIPDADCLVCHDQSQHQQGSVRLWNVDDPGNTAASIVLTGDPDTTSGEAAKLEAFCLACHDGDGANGDTAPFSDAVTAPAIDPAAWTGSSHAGSPAIVGCYGNGTYGCHASGHGSEKVTLLAPADVAPDATTLFEEQEGFCFACHDADGPASTDMAATYAGPILWVQQPVGAADNVNLNDRHDVEYAAQARSGAVIECLACHDPHTATSAQKVIPDPDPTDGRVPGSGFVSGSTEMTEWCLDCHDGSYPSSVTAPTTPLADVLQTYLSGGDAMGVGSVVPCESCHAPHASPYLFHADTVRYPDPNGPAVPPDGSPADLTDNSVQDPTVNGYYWCNTCHTNSMGQNQDNCFRCHYHGRRW